MGYFCLVWGIRRGISASYWCVHWIQISLYSRTSSEPCHVTADTVIFTSSTAQAFSSNHPQFFLEEIKDSRLISTVLVYNVCTCSLLITIYISIVNTDIKVVFIEPWRCVLLFLKINMQFSSWFLSMKPWWKTWIYSSTETQSVLTYMCTYLRKKLRYTV